MLAGIGLAAALLAPAPLPSAPFGEPLAGSSFRRPRAAWHGGAAARDRQARLGFDAGLWFSDWGVRAQTASGVAKTSAGPVGWVAPRFTFDLDDDWSATARLELGANADVDTKVLALHLSRPVWDMQDALVSAHVGPAVGTLEAHGFPGDFKDAFGFDFGLSGEARFSQRWFLNAGLTARYMKFDYSRSTDVTSSDDREIGPVGVLLSVGLTYRF